KDNLARRNWQGSKKCCFCTHDETIEHLFFQCNFARSTWSVIQIASSLYPPTSVANIFGHWLDGISNRFKTLLRVGAYALLWSLWLYRNDFVFNDKNASPLQAIFRCTHSLRMWSMLQRAEVQPLFKAVYTRLEQVATEVFTQHGWQHNLRIGPSHLST
uniref:Reverse transcriptase zinc-binding domain-containing protein n=1 Tax=Aegilops tauschii subsp. strangulata TaxID=200361 RepID=A0A452YE56_AEGTS